MPTLATLGIWGLRLLQVLPGIKTFFVQGFGFIGKHWRVFAVLSLVFFIVYQNQVATRFLFGIDTIPHLQQVIDKRDKTIAEQDKIILNLQQVVDEAVKANKLLTQTQEKINAQIEKWKNVSVDLERKNARLTATIRTMRREHEREVQNILDAPTPKTCQESMDFLRANREQLTWQK